MVWGPTFYRSRPYGVEVSNGDRTEDGRKRVLEWSTGRSVISHVKAYIIILPPILHTSPNFTPESRRVPRKCEIRSSPRFLLIHHCLHFVNFGFLVAFCLGFETGEWRLYTIDHSIMVHARKTTGPHNLEHVAGQRGKCRHILASASVSSSDVFWLYNTRIIIHIHLHVRQK